MSDSVADTVTRRVLKWLEASVCRVPSQRGAVAMVDVREGPTTQNVSIGAVSFDASDIPGTCAALTDLVMVAAGERAETKRGAQFALYALDADSKCLCGPWRLLVSNPDADSSDLPSTTTSRPATPMQREAAGFIATVNDAYVMFADRFSDVQESSTRAIRASTDVMVKALASADTATSQVQRAYDRLERAYDEAVKERDALRLEVPALRASLAEVTALANTAMDAVDNLKHTLDSPVERAKVDLIKTLFGRFISGGVKPRDEVPPVEETGDTEH